MPQLSTQEEDKKEKEDLFQSHLEKIEKQLESTKVESSKVNGKESLMEKDPITYIFQMDQFFDIHQVPTLQKVTIASLYIEPGQFVWY